MKCAATATLCVALVVAGSDTADAGVGSLIRKALSKIGNRGTSKVAGKAGASSARAGARTAGKISGRVGGKASGAAPRVGGHVTSKAGRTVVSHLGRGGEAALAKISPGSVPRLAELSKDLARSPYCDDWLSYIARAGDTALDLAWRNKGSIAVLSVATAMALRPAEFVEAGEHVATAAIESTAKHVAAPVAASVARHAVSAMPWPAIGNILLITGIGGGVFWYLRRR